MNLKEYPFLTGILSFFALIFLAGAGFTAWQQFTYASAKKELQGQNRARDNYLLRQAIAPTEDNLKLARKNNADAGAKVQDFLGVIRQKQITADFRQGATDLVTKLREDKDNLAKQVLDKGVRLSSTPAEFGFGFSRYVNSKDATTPPTTRLPDLALQSEIIKQLIRTLLEAKAGKEDIIILQTVQREPVELDTARSIATVRQEVKDECTPAPEEIVRREDVLQSYYFRITFTARTDVLRRYVNMIHSSGYPILLRGVTVSRAKPTVLEEPASKNADGESGPGFPPPADPLSVPGFAAPTFPIPAAPDATTPFGPLPTSATATTPAQPNIIIKDLPSEYTIAFEYVIPAVAPKEKSGTSRPGNTVKPNNN